MADIDLDSEISNSENTVNSVKALLRRKGYLDDSRTVVVIGFLDQMIEHHEATVLLLRTKLTGSAFALARSIVEALYRALWIQLCATEHQVNRFAEADKFDITMKKMAAAIDASYGMDTFFVDFLNTRWKSLNSFTHSGLLQLGRRFTGSDISPSYRDDEIMGVLRTVTAAVLVLARPFFVVHKQEEEAKEVDELMSRQPK